MFRNQHFERVRQMFEDQFEPEGDDFLYRKGMKAAPIRVTAVERDGFVTDFRRRLRYVTWGTVLGVVLAIALLVLMMPDVSPDDVNPMVAGLGMSVVLIIPFLLGFYWAWNAPARALERRATVGMARTRAEVGKMMLARISYGQFVTIGIIGAGALLLNVSRRVDVLHGWGRLWLVLVGAMVIGVLIQMFRKWRGERV